MCFRLSTFPFSLFVCLLVCCITSVFFSLKLIKKYLSAPGRDQVPWYAGRCVCVGSSCDWPGAALGYECFGVDQMRLRAAYGLLIVRCDVHARLRAEASPWLIQVDASAYATASATKCHGAPSAVLGLVSTAPDSTRAQEHRFWSFTSRVLGEWAWFRPGPKSTWRVLLLSRWVARRCCGGSRTRF